MPPKKKPHSGAHSDARSTQAQSLNKRQQLLVAKRLVKAAAGINDLGTALRDLGDGQSALSIQAAAALLDKVARLVKDRNT
jgi:hypothetical protein